MKFIDDARGAWRHYSTRALAAAASVQGMWLGMPDKIKADLPPTVGQVIAWFLFVVALGGLIGKFIDQTPTPKEPTQ